MMPFVKRKQVNSNDFFCLGVDYQREPELTLESIKEKTDWPYEIIIWDNDSTEEGVKDYLDKIDKRNNITVVHSPKNVGVWRASNELIRMASHRESLGFIKMDNDCEVVTANILTHIVGIYESVGPFDREYVLSPRVEGINNQPHRSRVEGLGGHPLGLTGHIGGLFCAIPAPVVREYRYPEDAPYASGQDNHFCAWANRRGAFVGYIEDLVVNHYETTDGQAARYPEYFLRKHIEETTKP